MKTSDIKITVGLDENNVPFEIIDFMETPLTEMELTTLLKKLNTDVQGLIRKNDRLYKEKFSGKEYSDEEWKARYAK